MQLAISEQSKDAVSGELQTAQSTLSQGRTELIAVQAEVVSSHSATVDVEAQNAKLSLVSLWHAGLQSTRRQCDSQTAKLTLPSFPSLQWCFVETLH